MAQMPHISSNWTFFVGRFAWPVRIHTLAVPDRNVQEICRILVYTPRYAWWSVQTTNIQKGCRLLFAFIKTCLLCKIQHVSQLISLDHDVLSASVFVNINYSTWKIQMSLWFNKMNTLYLFAMWPQLEQSQHRPHKFCDPRSILCRFRQLVKNCDWYGV